MNHLLHSPYAPLAAYILFSCIVDGMPRPTEKSSVGYIWAYNTLDMLASNVVSALKRVMGGASPLDVAVSERAAMVKSANDYADLGK